MWISFSLASTHVQTGAMPRRLFATNGEHKAAIADFAGFANGRRMRGDHEDTRLPNFRWRLPSRNWMIFLTVVGTWTTAVVYDRREKKRIQKKWCDLVADIAQQSSNPRELPRTLNVILAAPPGDSLAASQVYFKEYIKPVLVAAALEYDLIQGRREGDVRYGVAEQIRRLRRKKGEQSAGQETDVDGEQVLDSFRQQTGVYAAAGVKGDVVIGRHTWKEYIRGLHEGWLGPLDAPAPKGPGPEDREREKRGGDEKGKEAYIPASSYASLQLAPSTPSMLEPSQPFHQYHLLGFLKTPVRMWNFVNQRKLADECGRQAAAVVLAAYRPYHHQSDSLDSLASSSSSDGLDASPTQAAQGLETQANAAEQRHGQTWEQQTVNQADELTWVKAVRKPKKIDETKERIWMADMVMDPRIASRMRRFELEPEEEARAARIGQGTEKGRTMPLLELDKQASIIGNVDDEDA
ncbi:hypothetical protein DV737_g2984, partial [Chaetothyriales sp. CBS 132003]